MLTGLCKLCHSLYDSINKFYKCLSLNNKEENYLNCVNYKLRGVTIISIHITEIKPICSMLIHIYLLLVGTKSIKL